MREISTQEMDVVMGGAHRDAWIKRQTDDETAGLVRPHRWDHTQTTGGSNGAVVQPPTTVFSWRFWNSRNEQRGAFKNVNESK
jgi:hypothetical protein